MSKVRFIRRMGKIIPIRVRVDTPDKVGQILRLNRRSIDTKKNIEKIIKTKKNVSAKHKSRFKNIDPSNSFEKALGAMSNKMTKEVRDKGFARSMQNQGTKSLLKLRNLLREMEKL